jgi:putative ABC transport system substrate-binding protein
MKRSSFEVFIRVSALLVTAGLTQSAMPVDSVPRIAMVFPQSASPMAFAETAFWRRMHELGWVEGRSVLAVKRYKDGKLDQLPLLIADALSGRVDVLITPGTQSTMAAKRATTTIPIVSIMGDPVGTGLVESLARPGGNVTGVSIQNAEEIPGKWMELLREAVPGLAVVAAIVNPDNPLAERTLGNISRSERALGLKHVVLNARRPEDYAGAIEKARHRAQVAIVTPDPLSIGHREAIAELAKKSRLPFLGWTYQFVEAGALMAYGPDERVSLVS